MKRILGYDVGLKKRKSGFEVTIQKASVPRSTDFEKLKFQTLSQIVNADSAVWYSLQNQKLLLDVYNTIAPVNAVVNLKCEATANMKFKIKNLKNDEEYSGEKKTGIPIVDKTFELLSQPNPLQGTSEFLKHLKVNHQVFGNTYGFALTPSGFAEAGLVNWESALNLKVLPAQYTKPIGTGKYLFQSELNEIISHYLYLSSNERHEFNANSVMHINEINLDFDNIENRLMGRSKFVALNKEITNLAMTMESRNIIGKKRGALGIFSSALKNEGDVLPLQESDKKKAQEELKEYGTLEDQDQWIVTSQPLQFQRIIMNPKELGLFEEEEKSNIKVCNSFGVPEILMKLYVQGATFENQTASVARLYNETIIPESEDITKGLNRLLKIEEEGFKIIGDFSHIPALQENQNELATRRQKLTVAGEKLFLRNAITFNEWRKMSGIEPLKEPLGDKRLSELEDREIRIILNKDLVAESSQQE